MSASKSHLPGALAHLPLPIIGSPLFIISNPKLVIAQCIAGVVGSMPALNARPAEQLEEWLKEITETLVTYNAANPDKPAAPFAINQIVHKSNDRLQHDMAMCVKYKVPIITSLGAVEEINMAAHLTTVAWCYTTSSTTNTRAQSNREGRRQYRRRGSRCVGMQV